MKLYINNLIQFKKEVISPIYSRGLLCQPYETIEEYIKYISQDLSVEKEKNWFKISNDKYKIYLSYFTLRRLIEKEKTKTMNYIKKYGSASKFIEEILEKI